MLGMALTFNSLDDKYSYLDAHKAGDNIHNLR